MLNIDNKYDIGQIVYLKTDREQQPRMVLSIMVNKYDLLYELIVGTTTSRHYAFELSETVDVLTAIT